MSFSVTQEQAGKSARELLTAPVDSLLGVTQAGAEALGGLGIRSIEDLAQAELFHTARSIASANGSLSRVPRDRLTDEAALLPLSTLPASGIGTLRRLADPSVATMFELALGVKTIRELAAWPPYPEALDIQDAAQLGGRVSSEETDAPADLVPSSGEYPIERAQYEVLVLDETAFAADTDLATAGPIEIAALGHAAASGPAEGALLTWTQQWFTQGLGLGQLLHSLALAPGESTRIAMIDWNRRQAARVTEGIQEGEQLFSELERGRSISEVTSAVATEAQQGFSLAINKVEAGQFGIGSGGAMTGSYQGFNFAGGHGLSAGYAQGTSQATSMGWTTGRRDLSASMSQQIQDKTHQASSLTRSRWATVVREVSQSESERVSTRAVTNFNHMHALTVQYWEVVQLYRVTVQLTEVTSALFVPMRQITFDSATVTRFRTTIAAAGLRSEVRALASAEPGSVAISAPARAGNWSPARLDEWRTTLNQPIGEPADPAVQIPHNHTDFFFGYWEELPIDAVVLHWTDGSSSTFELQDFESSSNVYLPRFRAPLSGDWTKDDPSREWTDLRRIAYRRKAEESPTAQVARFGLCWDDNQKYLNALTVSIDVTVPREAGEFTVFEFDSVFVLSRLLAHLNANRAHYSRAIWSSLDSASTFALLRPYSWKGRPVVSQVDPLPIATVGDYLVFRRHIAPTADGAREWQAFLRGRDIKLGELRESLVPMPSGGVFAEAVLGRANSAERLDLSRFWNWQDSPIPVTAPEIADVQTGTRAQPDDTAPGSTPPPVLNIMNAPSLPDPTGMVAVLQAIQNGAMFRDMSGLAATIGAAQAALGRGFDASTDAAEQAGQNFKTAADLLSSYIGAQPGRGGGWFDGSSGGGSGITQSLPANPSNLGALTNAGQDLDAREAGTSGAVSDPGEWNQWPGEAGDGLSAPPLINASNEKAMLFNTKPAPAPVREITVKVTSRVEEPGGKSAGGLQGALTIGFGAPGAPDSSEVETSVLTDLRQGVAIVRSRKLRDDSDYAVRTRLELSNSSASILTGLKLGIPGLSIPDLIKAVDNAVSLPVDDISRGMLLHIDKGERAITLELVAELRKVEGVKTTFKADGSYGFTLTSSGEIGFDSSKLGQLATALGGLIKGARGKVGAGAIAAAVSLFTIKSSLVSSGTLGGNIGGGVEIEIVPAYLAEVRIAQL